MKNRIACVVCGCFMLSLFGCANTSDFGWEITSDYNCCRFTEAMTKLKPKLQNRQDKDLALNYLRSASCAMSCRDYTQAKDSLLSATQIMERFEPDGEFKAVMVEESAKDFLGDPYEQMMAFFYLGLLDYRDGEYDKALASFKTALLADAGSREERYKADSSMLLLMMGQCHRRLNEPEAAAECFDDAKRVAFFRPRYSTSLQALKEAMEQLEAQLDENEKNNKDKKEELEAAKELCVRELSLSAMDTDSYEAALAAAADGAIDLMGSITTSEKCSKEDKDLHKLLKSEDRRARVLQYIGQLAQAATENLSKIDTAKREQCARRISGLVDQLSTDSHNVLLFVELGKAPYKYRLGHYGEVYAVGRGWCPARRCEVAVDGKKMGSCCLMEDVYYQASTRGGRAMDAILKDKAVFKDVTRKSSDFAFDMANEMSRSSSGQSAEAAAVMQLAALAFLLVSESTRAEVDVRYWEMLPNELHMVCGFMKPGSHTMELTFYGQGEDGAESELDGYRQRWEKVTVQAGKENVFLFRSGPNQPTNRVVELVSNN